MTYATAALVMMGKTSIVTIRIGKIRTLSGFDFNPRQPQPSQTNEIPANDAMRTDSGAMPSLSPPWKHLGEVIQAAIQIFGIGKFVHEDAVVDETGYESVVVAFA
jgi:hypothetical protein